MSPRWGELLRPFLRSAQRRPPRRASAHAAAAIHISPAAARRQSPNSTAPAGAGEGREERRHSGVGTAQQALGACGLRCGS